MSSLMFHGYMLMVGREARSHRVATRRWQAVGAVTPDMTPLSMAARILLGVASSDIPAKPATMYYEYAPCDIIINTSSEFSLHFCCRVASSEFSLHSAAGLQSCILLRGFRNPLSSRCISVALLAAFRVALHRVLRIKDLATCNTV